MAGRPQLPVGAYGKITTRDVTPQGADVPVFEAMCRVRDLDGHTRRVKARRKSRTAAETALKQALAERHHTVGTLTGASRVRDAGTAWLEQRHAEMQAGDIAARTYEVYAAAWRNHVAPTIGELQLREATTARCEAWQIALRKRKGPPTVKRARAVLGQVLGYAARMGAIPTSPVKDVSPIPSGRTRKPRAMTADERRRWLDHVDTHPTHLDGTPDESTIRYRALGDVSRLMLATGCRIGEVMALSWDDVDLEVGTVDVRHHLVRVKGEGLLRIAGTKRGDGRLLRLPSWAVDMLMARRINSEGATPVFPSMLGDWRDPSSVHRWIIEARAELDMPWLTSHTFRKTTITFLDDQGVSTREVADQAGHAEISQTQQYMARKVASDRAATALEGLL